MQCNVRQLALAGLLCTAVSTAATAAATGAVCLYTKANYAGKALCLDADNPALTGKLNNNASSVRIRAGAQATLFSDANYAGKSLVLTTDTPDLAAVKFSNKTSSVRVANVSTAVLHANGRQIVDAQGATVQLKGFNLGGWFVMEDYMSPMDAGTITDTYTVMTTLTSRFGLDQQRALMKTYQQSWINGGDLDNIKNAGFNAIRVPVWWGQFFALDNPTITGWRSDAFDMLDWVVNNAAARGLYVIIDMHGVIGGQNVQSTTGRANSNAYWDNSEYQSNTAWMWWQIANHYKGNAAVAGYDLINEPMGAPSNQAMWTIYNNLYGSIRSADPDHMIFIEGTWGNWNWDMLPPPSQYGWTNVVYEMHEYQTDSDASKILAGSERQVADFNNHANWNVPAYVGEFNDFMAGSDTWRQTIADFDNAGMSWTMWSYKAVNGVAPNPWGWYDPTFWPDRPNVSTDSADEIARKWSLWTTPATFAINSSLGIQP